MSSAEPIRIFYFSDVLCVWAYIAQIRLNELKKAFGDKVAVQQHFVTVFGDTQGKLVNRWRDRGGLSGYGRHVRETTASFSHVTVHADTWERNVPSSSISCHVFLGAIRLLEQKGIVEKSAGIFDKTVWAMRAAFFTQAVNICDRAIQFQIAEELGLPVASIQEQIDSGEAYAQLSQDLDLVKEYNVTVSPTMVFNEGRQRLNGNVGYRIIEANIRELIETPPGEQSWC